MIEAITRGVPVICSDLDVFREQIELYRCGDHVRVFKMDDAEALTQQMEAVLREPPKRLSADEISAITSRWTWRNVAETYIKELQATSSMFYADWVGA